MTVTRWTASNPARREGTCCFGTLIERTLCWQTRDDVISWPEFVRLLLADGLNSSLTQPFVSFSGVKEGEKMQTDVV